MTLIPRQILDVEDEELQVLRRGAAQTLDSGWLFCESCGRRWFRDVTDADWQPYRDGGKDNPDFADDAARGWVMVFAISAGFPVPLPLGILCADCARDRPPQDVDVIARRILERFEPVGAPN